MFVCGADICLYVEPIYIHINILCLADIYLFFNKTPCGGRTAHDCNYAQTRLRLLRKLLCGTGTARRCCSAVGGLPSSLAGFISPMSRSCVKDQGRHQNHPSQIATTVHAFGPACSPCQDHRKTVARLQQHTRRVETCMQPGLWSAGSFSAIIYNIIQYITHTYTYIVYTYYRI
jgi:hypothetical protein